MKVSKENKCLDTKYKKRGLNREENKEETIRYFAVDFHIINFLFFIGSLSLPFLDTKC